MKKLSSINTTFLNLVLKNIELLKKRINAFSYLVLSEYNNMQIYIG